MTSFMESAIDSGCVRRLLLDLLTEIQQE